MLAKWTDERSKAAVRAWGGGKLVGAKTVDRFPCHTQNIQAFSPFTLTLTVPGYRIQLENELLKVAVLSRL